MQATKGRPLATVPINPEIATDNFVVNPFSHFSILSWLGFGVMPSSGPEFYRPTQPGQSPGRSLARRCVSVVFGYSIMTVFPLRSPPPIEPNDRRGQYAHDRPSRKAGPSFRSWNRSPGSPPRLFFHGAGFSVPVMGLAVRPPASGKGIVEVRLVRFRAGFVPPTRLDTNISQDESQGVSSRFLEPILAVDRYRYVAPSSTQS